MQKSVNLSNSNIYRYRSLRCRTVLDAVIYDLEGIAESAGRQEVEWMTLTPYSTRVGTPRQTLIGRLSAWYDHYRRLSMEPWRDPLSCPIYRVGSMPRLPRRGRRPGCWLLDASREREIWHRLRDFSCLSRSEHQRVHQLAESARRSDVHSAYAAWHLQHTAN
jgi:hypothetical protein